MRKGLKTKKLTHDELKEMGKKVLSDEGFKSLEIRTEYMIKVANDKRYILDVAAVRGGKVLVGIECGDLQVDKFLYLTEVLPKVVHIPYHFKALPNVTLDYCALYTENERLKRKLDEINKAPAPVAELPAPINVVHKSENSESHSDVYKDCKRMMDKMNTYPDKAKLIIDTLMDENKKLKMKNGELEEKSIKPQKNTGIETEIVMEKKKRMPKNMPESELLNRLDALIEKVERVGKKGEKHEG